jgi:radical SAM protein with 4Fe4S-binding SPASM domain
MTAVKQRSYGDVSSELFRSSGEDHLIRAQIEPTYACNLHCLHCYTDCFNRPELLADELSTDEVLDTLDQLQALGVLWLCLTGGEILERPDFFEIYDAATDRGFLVTLFSNGTSIGEAEADRLASRPPFSIELSLHGATAETVDRFTQVPGSFERQKDGLRRLLERDLPVKLKTCGTRLNLHELDDVKAFVESRGLAFRLDTAIYPRLNGDTTPTLQRLSPLDRVQVERHFAGDLETGECPLRDPPREPAPARLYRCGCGSNTVHVDPHGHVGACTWQREPRFCLREAPLEGNVQTLFARIRKVAYQGSTACRRCEIHNFCDKKPGVAAAETGDAEAPVPHFCETAQLRAE